MSLPWSVHLPRVGAARSNYISTTKYSLLSFFPLALLLQFKRYANLYFLICAILQSIPLISPLNPASAVAPLLFVLALSMLREGFEDYKRWRSDQADNSQTCSVYSGGLQLRRWRDLLPADLVRIAKDEIIPADALLLLTAGSGGIAYVETASLDGEKNLKPKFAVAQLQRYCNKEGLPDFAVMRGEVKCKAPSAEIEAFEGEARLVLGSVEEAERVELEVEERVGKKNVLLRGCKLKNTEWVVGMVLYTGEDTAIMMNGSRPHTKISSIEVKVNNIILAILGFEVVCCLASALYCYFSCRSSLPFEELVGSSGSCARVAGIAFGSYFILYSTFIPISLIVSMEFVKVFQGYFMSSDREMFCALNQRALECHTVSINEELGQIEYILTDKTGTLTCNQMEFRNIVIGSEIYGEGLNSAPIGENINFERLSSRFSRVAEDSKDHFDSKTLSYDLAIEDKEKGDKHRKRQLIELIFMMIATCHECVPAAKGYEGPSPDEVALVNAAAKVGFRFVSCENKIITVEYNNKLKKFELLKLVEFDSDRKRMTVVLKTSKGVSVFVKGADTSVERLLAPNQLYLKDVREKTVEMTKTGLRSLWFAYKTYPLDINISEMSVEEIEKDLTLVGATGIEDKLQDYVAETIYSLRSGGIKFIMLTGDKLETAENIALSCRLIEEGELIRNKQDLRIFAEYVEKIQRMEIIGKSPVIDGSSLSFVECEQDLLTVIEKVKSVVFCRVTPGQKAEIVRLVKKLGKKTLAIGDGANDVNMIQEADVGVGIFGEEGTRAAQVANFAIGEFCLLWKLVLFYGRLNYMRVTELILYFFYKNMVFTAVQFVYSFYSLGSGQSFWLSWSITFYNMIFTFFPVVIRAVFEVDLEMQSSKQTFHDLSQGLHEKQVLYSYYPKLYFIGQKNKLFTKSIFASWFFLGLAQGVICYLLTVYAIGDQRDTSGIDSYQPGFYLVEISAYTSVIIVVTLKLAVNVRHWTIILAIGFIVPSLGFYFAFTFLLGALEDTVTYHSMTDLLTMPTFYLIQFLSVGGMFCFDFFLFSLEATKNNFENYLKYRSRERSRLSEGSLKQYMMEMSSNDKEIAV